MWTVQRINAGRAMLVTPEGVKVGPVPFGYALGIVAALNTEQGAAAFAEVFQPRR